MNCQDILLLLDDADLSSLNPETSKDIETHLAGCADCARAWTAQTDLLELTPPAMSSTLAARCRNLLPEQAPVVPRRRLGRHVAFGALLVAGLSAAAFVAVQLNGTGTGSTDVGQAPLADTTEAVEPGRPPTESEQALVPTADITDVRANSAIGQTVAAGGFTVAVAPLRQQAADPETIRITSDVFAELLDALRGIPGLELIELSEQEMSALPGPSGLSVVGVAPETTPAGADVSLNEAPPGSAVVSVARAGTGTALNRFPSTLSSRIEEVTGGAGDDAMAGPVNVILSNNIQHVASFSMYTADTDAATSMPYDHLLIATSSGSAGTWRISVEARSAPQELWSFTFADSGTARIAEMLSRIVDQLRRSLFRPDVALMGEVESRLLDFSLPEFDRIAALNELRQIVARSEDLTLSDAAFNSALGLARTASNPQVRAGAWNTLRDPNDDRMLQPLSDALLYDPDEVVRLAAAQALAAYDDERARAALAAAGRNDASADIRRNARWASLDDAGRRELLVSSLLNTQLGVDERLAPLELATDRRGWGTGIDGIEPIIDPNLTAAIGQLLGDVDEPERRVNLLQVLGRFQAPALTPVLMARLRDDTEMEVRYTAAMILQRHVDEPGVLQALEDAAANDASETVRLQARNALLAAGLLQPPP